MQQMLLSALGVGPDFQQQIKAFAQAIVEMDRRTQRIEAMLISMERRLIEFGLRSNADVVGNGQDRPFVG